MRTSASGGFVMPLTVANSRRRRIRRPQASAVRNASRSVTLEHLFTGEDGAGRSAVTERGTAQLLASVRGQPVGRVRTGRDDLRRIDIRVDDVVVLLDLREVDRVPEPRRLEQVARVGPQRRQFAELV